MARSHRIAPVLVVAVALLAGCGQSDSPTAPDRLLPHGASPAVGDVIAVTNTNDAGPGSLRQAILDATGGEIIRFDAAIAGGTIALTSGELSIDKALTIEGSGTVGMTISGNWATNVIRVGASGDVVLRNLSIIDARAEDGGGVRSFGKLLIDHSLIAFNEVYGSKPYGGGIRSSGTLIIVNSTIAGNVAGTGSGIFAENGDVTIRNSTISGNTASFGSGIRTLVSMSLRNTVVAGNINARVG